MGFFSEIASEARRSSRPSASPQPATPVLQGQQHVFPPKSVPAAPGLVPTAQTPEPATPPATPAEQPEPPATPAPPAQSPPPGLKLDTAEDAAQPPDDDARCKAHEAAEAKRKAEWDAKQAKKKAAEQEQLAKLTAMSDEEILAASMKRVGDDTEKLTRRQLMECVMEHIQNLCLSDPAFARKVMHPRKNMIRCAQFINRKAWEYVQDELKARNITPSRTDPYASAIPEGICYQWAEDYFNDPDAKEDHQDDEKFVPKPYVPASAPRKAAKAKADKKPVPEKKPKAGNQADSSMEQIRLM